MSQLTTVIVELHGYCGGDEKMRAQGNEGEGFGEPLTMLWWVQLKMERITNWQNHILMTILGAMGNVVVHEMLCKIANYLTRISDTEIFLLMYMVLY